jgi:hypothetical protein
MANKIQIEFWLDNSAYQDKEGNLDYHSIQDQIVLIAQEIGDGNTSKNIADYNGNTVGEFFISEEI